jgi:hypothetical protein
MRRLLLIGCIVLLAPPLLRAADEEELRYEATYVDGTREAVKKPPLWIARENEPELNGKPILTGAKPLRRLHMLGTAALARVAERVELIAGDRLTGRVVDYLPEVTEGVNRPACLVIEPILAADEPLPDEPERIRVPLERIRRVVWEESTYRPYRPGAFFYRDGRRTTFRSLRWESGKLKLLLEQGIEEVAWEDAAEVHLPERDPWDEYVDQLAILMPQADGRIVRFETPGRTRITVSPKQIKASGNVSDADSQKFDVHPAWSLDPIAIPQRLSASQTFFAPHELPLSRFEPSAYVHRSILAGGWNQWRADANVQGGVLAAAEREFGWGFGVHAYAALQFDLPATARYFRTTAALDRSAGNGGTVRGRVFFGSTQTADNPGGKPLVETPVLIGSTQTFDSNRLELKTQPGRPNRLVLVCDSVPNESAASADPLDLRDVFDWLEPIVELDPALLKTEIAKHAASLFVRRHRWVVQGPYNEAWRWEVVGPSGRKRQVVEALKSPLVLTRTMSIPADCVAIRIHAAAVDGTAGSTRLLLQSAGKKLDEEPLPTGGDPLNPPKERYFVDKEFRGREVKLEMVLTPSKPGLRLDFYGVDFDLEGSADNKDGSRRGK